ncbi:DUF6907 domain-containing protein [Streptomyces capillispiralis]|uniref:DUF6907 domain-containing protein n=1 Tax=Streptomyces capillispiralis TaxID=68182 RepID=UPI00369A3DBA
MAQSAISQHVAALMGAIPSQPAAPTPAAPEPPRSWSFIDRRTGETVQYTCMQGCDIDHSREIGRRIFREDVWCWTKPEPLTLPVNTNGYPEEFRVLDTLIKVEPWSEKVAERLPFAVVELVDDHFVEGLDPDGLETVINTLSARVEEMRATHRRLLAVREEYMRRGRTVRHANGLEFTVIPADSYDARMARDVRELTMEDGSVWTVGTRGAGSTFAWQPKGGRA